MNSFELSGTKVSVEELRSALLAEPQSAQITVTNPSPLPEQSANEAARVRQPGLEEAVFAFAVHIPAGVAAHLVYDWVRDWLKKRADQSQVRVKEVISAAPSDAKGGSVS